MIVLSTVCSRRSQANTKTTLLRTERQRRRQALVRNEEITPWQWLQWHAFSSAMWSWIYIESVPICELFSLIFSASLRANEPFTFTNTERIANIEGRLRNWTRKRGDRWPGDSWVFITVSFLNLLPNRKGNQISRFYNLPVWITLTYQCHNDSAVFSSVYLFISDRAISPNDLPVKSLSWEL